MEYILSMIFLNSIGTKSTLTISGVKPDITGDKVKALMQKIVEKEFFLTNKGLLVGISDAQLTQREIKKFDVK